MAWDTAIDDLRAKLYDGATSRLRWRKKVFGDQDGVNLVFKTFEQRRITVFSSPTSPTGVFVNGVAASVTLDDPESGEFTLATPPVSTDTLNATYYFRFFDDAELGGYLAGASEWLGNGADYLTMVDGLRPAALCFASADAFQNMAVRVSDMPSEQYRLEDSPDDKTDSPSDRYLKVSESYRKQAKNLRDAFYTRQGKSLQPLYGTVKGRVANIP
jgi:hypothetical protein